MKFDILMTDGFWCDECKGYGDDYYFDEDGELVSSLRANGWRGSAKIRYCPMCGRDLFVK